MKQFPNKNQFLLLTALMITGVLLNAAGKPHVLFIAVDDLRPELGCYGKEAIQSPNIDKLAAAGTLFERAYCQVPVCGASRASLMTGLYPTDERFLTYYTKADEEVNAIYDLPGWFKKNGYKTISNGKIYHQRDDFALSWDILNHSGGFRRYVLPENIKLPNNQQPPFEKADVPDSAYPDGEIAAAVIRNLQEAKQSNRPHFIAAGFSKPHLPFNAPRKYWDLYQREELSLPDNYRLKPDAPREAIHKWNELRGQYGTVPQEGPVSDDMALNLIHGYYASVSYVDAMIGKVLDALDSLEMRDNTIIILWGDHGWQLGEHTLWCKHALFQTSLNAPLIISAPGYNRGQSSRSIVEFVDIYPTLCELAGIGMPGHLQGRSIKRLLEDPNDRFKMAAYSQYGSGRTVKTNSLSYTEWSSGARMLFDHTRDVDENTNEINNPKYKLVISKLSELLTNHRQKVSEADQAYQSSPEAVAMLSSNVPPKWKNSKFKRNAAETGEAYSTYVNYNAVDTDQDRLSYAKVSGPAWLKLTNRTNGRFQGSPSIRDSGLNTFIISVSDGINLPVRATMEILVEVPQGGPIIQNIPTSNTTSLATANTASSVSNNLPPAWSKDRFNQKSASAGQAYITYVNFRVVDAEGDNLTYAKVSGPEWLSLINVKKGGFKGVPQAENVGRNSFVVSVSDGTNPPIEATMQILVESN